MKSKSAIGLFTTLLIPVLAFARLEFSPGLNCGVSQPIGGGILHYGASLDEGADFRLTGFEPVLGVGLRATRTRFTGPRSDSVRYDSTKFAFRYLPVTAYLFTDMSRAFPKSPVLPYLRFGAGVCPWDFRYAGNLVTLPDSSKSEHVDAVFTAGIGAEYRPARIPLSVVLELGADYVSSSHITLYGPTDKDESFAYLNLGLRYRTK